MAELDYDWDQSIGAAVFATARRLRAAMARELEPYGVTHPQWMILALLVRRDGRAQGELAEELGVEASTLCRTLDGMERSGWIRRVGCAEDRRRKRIVLGARARPVWQEMSAVAHRVRDRALRGMPEADRRALLGHLAQVRHNLRASETADAR